MRQFFTKITTTLQQSAAISSAAVVAVTLVSAWLLFAAHATAAGSTGNQHLLTIHDGTTTRGVITTADTLSDALKQAHISVNGQDLVEPSLDSKLTTSNYDVNIYRALPVTVIDGATKVRIMSPYRVASQIVKQAGITLHDADSTTLSSDADVVTSGGGLTLTIKRATPYTLVLYGKTIEDYTQAKTVGELLKQKGITLGKDDTLSLPATASITDGTRIEIWRNGTQTVTQEEAIAFTTREVQSADQPVGYRQVQSQGADGKRMATYAITMKNGQQVARSEIQSVVITQPTDQVVIVGTKVSLPAGSHEDWMAQAGMAQGDYGYINYIFSHESGWNPASSSPGGTYVGLGQTSPSKLSGACPAWRSDPICQIGFFNGYAVGRYGSWQAAYNFKLAHGWW